MRLLIPSLFVVFIISCARDFNKLKLNVDQPTDVESKIGKPDSIARDENFTFKPLEYF